jgi:hypothetical protein
MFKKILTKIARFFITKEVILLAILLVALFFVSSTFLTEDGRFAFFASSSQRAEQTALVTELLSLLKVLERATFDTSFMEQELFQELEDKSIDLVPQPKGKRNPFTEF